ncbi:hypothetical protein SAY87_003108 [Trapa incisa]|uniref:CID domain-containing protein n=1 Tax=Trapa incisa TaxID=236973 RepID=A0AAN7KKD6_9MYRT|nr:hypothetical protein SAY87_003108 [Trapa incisa]
MGSTFNPQILVEKLTKLNLSQTSIETLSHWCIFHMYRAKQVVETWDKQFHCAPREQRLAFLYLANDILQNSRRKGSDFVGEFWKVLPNALGDVIQNGDEFGRASAMRLINIWEERKVFGSRGVKAEFLGRNIESDNQSDRDSGLKLRHNAGGALDKILTGYQIVYGGSIDDEIVLNKCCDIMAFFDKLETETGGDGKSEKFHDPAFVEELRGQSVMLRNCIDQLTAVESSRYRLVSNLRDALQEQEFKLDQVRKQLQAARSRFEQSNSLYHQFLNGNDNHRELPVNDSSKDADGYDSTVEREQPSPVMYSMQVSSVPDKSASEEDPPKSTAAEVAAKLTASTSSAQMLSYVLSSLASEGVIGNNQGKDSPAEKRAKVEADKQSSAYIPLNPDQTPLPPFSPFPPSESLPTGYSIPVLPTPPPMLPLPSMPLYPMQLPPLIPPGPANGMPYYGMGQLQPPLPPPSLLPYTPISRSLPPFTAQPRAGSISSVSGSDGSLYSQPASVPMAPISPQ